MGERQAWCSQPANHVVHIDPQTATNGEVQLQGGAWTRALRSARRCGFVRFGAPASGGGRGEAGAEKTMTRLTPNESL